MVPIFANLGQAQTGESMYALLWFVAEELWNADTAGEEGWEACGQVGQEHGQNALGLALILQLNFKIDRCSAFVVEPSFAQVMGSCV